MKGSIHGNDLSQMSKGIESSTRQTRVKRQRVREWYDTDVDSDSSEEDGVHTKQAISFKLECWISKNQLRTAVLLVSASGNALDQP